MPVSVILAALTTILLWGGSPVATKIAAFEFPAAFVGVARICAGGVFALLLALAQRVPLPSTREQKVLLAVSGFSGFVGFPVIYAVGLSMTSGVHGSMIHAFTPVFTGAFAHLWDRSWPRRIWWIGCLLALIGEFVVVSHRDSGMASDTQLTGDLLVWLSALIVSIGYVAGGRLQRSGYSAHGTTYWGVTFGAVILLPFLGLSARGTDFSAVSAAGWAGLAYMAIASSVLGYVAWYWALGKGGIARVGLFQFLQPVVSIYLSYLLLGETLSIWLVLGGVLIIAGIFIATRPPGFFRGRARLSRSTTAQE